MNKFMFYAFILILVYILIVYYKGTGSTVSYMGQFIDRTILFLQGRDQAGNQAGYPVG